MSADYPAAVSLGATHIRLGTAIFGPRGLAYHAHTVGRDVRQNTPHNGARYGDTAKRRLEIIFSDAEKWHCPQATRAGHH